VFFWKRATTAGAITSIILGTVVTIAWNLAQAQFGWQKEVDAVYPALAASVLSLIGVSYATSRPSEEKLKPFFE
jgi:SSS family solute:Na+ symporter